MNKKVPILDNFYNDNSSITAKKNVLKKHIKLKEYIEENNIDVAVILFNPYLDDFLSEYNDVKILSNFTSGVDSHNIYVVNNVIVVNSFVGGPNAAGLMEELIMVGIKKIIASGTCGIIEKSDNKIHLIDKAIRDEGTSYQYIKPSIYINTSRKLNNIIIKFLNDNNISYDLSTCWTTDGYYHETLKEIDYRKKQGATVIDMECAAWCAVAKKYKVDFSQIVFPSDYVNKNWRKNTIDRKKIKNYISLIAINIAKYIGKNE